ncbi:MAG: hypothetical protein HY720_00190 [Planctomycetes bacterium]|nr:hypothetical protein [Planctomycetota bacterium]
MSDELYYGLYSKEEIDRYRRIPPDERTQLAIDLARQMDRIMLALPEEELLRRCRLINKYEKDVGTEHLVEKFRSLR